jgi:hypothetical protein
VVFFSASVWTGLFLNWNLEVNNKRQTLTLLATTPKSSLLSKDLQAEGSKHTWRAGGVTHWKSTCVSAQDPEFDLQHKKYIPKNKHALLLYFRSQLQHHFITTATKGSAQDLAHSECSALQRSLCKSSSLGLSWCFVQRTPNPTDPAMCLTASPQEHVPHST